VGSLTFSEENEENAKIPTSGTTWLVKNIKSSTLGQRKLRNMYPYKKLSTLKIYEVKALSFQ